MKLIYLGTLTTGVKVYEFDGEVVSLHKNGRWYTGQDLVSEKMEKELNEIWNQSLTDGMVLDEIREAVANYIRSEGCSCCQDIVAHREHEKRLAELLKVDPYLDNSGYDFSIFCSKDR